MKKLTLQQIFNKAVLGVVRQGARAAVGSKGAGCKYRIQKGDIVLACGVGQLIDDEMYTPDIEDAPARHAFPARDGCMNETRADKLMLALCFSGIDVTDKATVDFLDAIQLTHDSALDVQDFAVACRRLASDYCLSMPTLPAKYV